MIIDQRVVLVTGSARRLGRAIALGLGSRGARVIVHYGASEREAHATRDDVRALGVDSEAFGADLAEPTEIDALFERIEARFGALDVLVNNAAIFESGPLDDVTLEAWQRSLDVNLTAPFLCSQRAARLMRDSAANRDAPGVIINMADLSGIHPWREHVQHGVSKAGLIHLTRIMARELAPEVRVNAIAPGPILPPPGVDASDEDWLSTAERVPLRRLGHTDDIVEAIAYLISADFVTGSILRVDGGEGLLGPVGH